MTSYIFRGYAATKGLIYSQRTITIKRLSTSYVSCKYHSSPVGCYQKINWWRLNCANAPNFSFMNNRQASKLRLHTQNSPYDVNTKVSKDVILFKYENPRFFRILNAFALCQFFFWSYLSHFCFTKLRDAPVERNAEDQPFWRRINLGENKFKNSLAVFCFIIGYGILSASWMFTLKSVRFLILRKGGKSVSFVTYGPLGTNRILTVGLENVSAAESRNSARVQLPIKVKGHLMYYMLDMRGEFKNARLFDSTAGLKRLL
ncbi:transmembrane protein 223 [Hetaerina americana]|uniref:transmembrane protein 223 n=1 Tax=Hetaerina americana TaxID=62018 RepID=UPI003A7F49B1